MAILFLLLAISAEVAATSLMMWAGGFTRLGPSLLIAAGYALAFYFLSLTLGDIPAGVAYAVWSGVGVVMIAAIAWVFGGQKLDPAAVIGMALIVAGVAVLNLFSKAGLH